MYAATAVEKRYGGVVALAGVDLEIHPGEVHALIGANGAGKSTLAKILCGAEQPTSGTLHLEGKQVNFSDVGEAADHGVAIVSQELNLFPDFDILHNLFLLREPLRGGLISRAEMWRRAEPVVRDIGLDVPLDRRLGDLRLGEQQLVEIARALLEEPKILILDEPNSALQARETQRLLEVVRVLRDRGVGIVYVSHFLEDVFTIADTITVFRNGQVAVQRVSRTETTIPDVVDAMLGEARTKRGRQPVSQTGPNEGASLRLSGVSIKGGVEDLDLEVRPGEVVGMAGLEGSGVEMVFDVLFGVRPMDEGEITLPNGRRAPRNIGQAVKSGVALVPADRKKLGVMLDKSIYENVAQVNADALGRLGFLLRKRKLIARAEDRSKELSVRMDSMHSKVGELSGGNQQKIVFAKWLEADPAVFLLDDPTRGVDIGAKVEMHGLVADLAARGRIVLVTSSDLDELASLCDRVIVFFQSRICGEIPREELSEHRLLEAINTGQV